MLILHLFFHFILSITLFNLHYRLYRNLRFFIIWGIIETPNSQLFDLMPRHTLQSVNLQYSHAVKGRKDYVADPYSGKAFERVVKDGKVLEKSIHAYRMWFNFLKLGLELEEQNAVLITRNSVKGYDEQKGQFRTDRISHKVKVNRKKYADWNVNEILNMSFNDWWKEHRQLFQDQIGKVLQPNEVVSSNPDTFSYEFDKRRRLSDAIKDLRQYWEENKIERVSRDKFAIIGKVRPIVLQNRFNALVLKLEDTLSNEEILTHKNNYIRSTDTRTAKGRHKGVDGRIIYELLSGSKKSFGAKQILLSVCDGYFMKHPTKTYTE